jgi:hypothetical protein
MQPEKKRVIVDYKNITNDLLELLNKSYPDGYEDAVIRFKNAKDELVSAVPLETDDTKYLVKVSVQLAAKLEAYLEDDDDSDDAEDDDIAEDNAFTEEESEED